MSDFQTAVRQIDQAAAQLFQVSPAVRSVGVGKFGDGYGYEVVKNSHVIELQAADPTNFSGIPIRIKKTGSDVFPSVLKVPYSLFTQGAPSFIPETQRTRPLVCGLQIQNFDADQRDGTLAKGFITIGTLGCFVTTKTGATALLSNNHVVAAQNHGQASDQIVQANASNPQEAASNLIANLSDFVKIDPSPAGSKVGYPGLHLNRVDAGCAVLIDKMGFLQRYMSSELPAINGVDNPVPEQEVFKVGRTTGLTRGNITTVATTVGPVPYADGESWFQGSFVVEGKDGTRFSDKGDSGSAVVSSDGKLLGLLYAGNGVQTYVCPITDVFNLLQCKLA